MTETASVDGVHHSRLDSAGTSGPYVYPFNDGAVLYYPATEKLVVLNPTGHQVWEMLGRGYSEQEIAEVFVRQFAIPVELAVEDISRVLSLLRDASVRNMHSDEHEVDLAVSDGADGLPNPCVAKARHCGSFRFGHSRVRVLSSVAETDASFFSRFGHRAVTDEDAEDVLEIAATDSGYRLTFRGDIVEEVATAIMANSRVIQLLLKLEHPNTALLAYCHAAAVCRDGQSLLMPGRSGAGKSTLTGYLVAHGFAYLGDDINAIGEEDAALLPLPSCLSIKAGSWPLIEKFFPVLRQRPTLSRYGRNIRYLEPEQNYETMFAANAPSAIVFPAYSVGAATQLRALPPLETMIRMVGAHTTIFVPATEAKIAKLIRFVENTPAYELTYSELPEAMRVIEGLLSTHRH
jgi:hypothetical protein